jgi:hypothetical protein
MLRLLRRYRVTIRILVHLHGRWTGYGGASSCCREHCTNQEKRSASRNYLIIHESGLYRRIMRSNKPEAQGQRAIASRLKERLEGTTKSWLVLF